ncbi:YdcF family protein [Aliiroseovarius sp. S2029]|uniref:YdcF family protein n=1 Tax=Aliiroseovarius sp. S2029 TaxID=2936988 RepID=UPI0020BF1802|nr:YdcF family protein [Aliiroseovarius sp. S2029]MCK8483741.1 YdcF family protein [Aliiroseovarius sp. S2029]
MTRVAIVLGAAVRPDGSASPALARRARAAADLYQRGQVDQIIASGGVPRAGHSEASVIAQICVQAGVPAAAIQIEDQSANTLENIRNSKTLLPPDAQVVLVTDRYHAFRARLTAREFGLSPVSESPSLMPNKVHRIIRGYGREAAALLLYVLRRVGRIISQPSR